jgi:imidazolonepropionase-like amidohydrolase
MSRAGMRRALRVGVRHVCGTDAGTPFNRHGSAPREIVAMVGWGMTPLRAMQAATANGAELLGLSMAGRIQVGAEADLVLYDGNPLEEIQTVLTPTLVLRAGDVVAGDAG